ncbi:YheC/YheD family protein [Alteribacter populi]|uniref:YheC/YheD family endospore coat-associated protein n=1 Tax=Alteribacter populi TaxID=2011011 RepID=UPI0012FD3DCE|nr:YheC/YheD family protein [Alteribacter populi]
MRNLTFGILQLDNDQEKEYVTQIAIEGAAKNAAVHLFTPWDWDEKTNQVNGYQFDKNSLSFLPATFPLPNVLYDRCFYNRTPQAKKAAAIVKELKTKAYFLGYGLPDKWTVHQYLQEDSFIASFLPETQLLVPSRLVSMIREYKHVIIKPLAGSGGKGIHKISRKKSAFEWLDAFTLQTSVHLSSPSLLKNELKRKTAGIPYLIQPCLPLIDSYHRPFDLRVVLRKDRQGKWKELGRGIRTGETGGIVSNLQAGGSISSFSSDHLTETQRADLTRVIDSIGGHLESHHPRLFELGVDLGFDQNGRFWILEVNSKPGMQTVLSTTDFKGRSTVYKGPIDTFLFIKNRYHKRQMKRQKGAKVIHE